jgi:hypothetical protein
MVLPGTGKSDKLKRREYSGKSQARSQKPREGGTNIKWECKSVSERVSLLFLFSFAVLKREKNGELWVQSRVPKCTVCFYQQYYTYQKLMVAGFFGRFFGIKKA